MSETLLAARTAAEVRAELDATYAELGVTPKNADTADVVADLHNCLRMLNSELRDMDDDTPSVVADVSPEQAAYENYAAARAEGLRRIAEQMNGDVQDAPATTQERLSALRHERERIPFDLPKFQAENATRVAVVDAEIAAVEAELARETEEAVAAIEAATKTPEVLRATQLAELEAHRSSLALKAYDGDESARVELDEIDRRTAELARTAELERLASVERDRLAREAEAAGAAEVERVRLEEIAALSATRDERYFEAVTAVVSLGVAVRALTDVDSEYVTLSGERVRPGMTPGGKVVEFVLVALREAGIRRFEMPDDDLRASYRNEVREMLANWGKDDEEPDAVESVAKTRAHCRACEHADRAGLDAALSDNTLRQVEAQFGVSKSVLSEHKKVCLADGPA